MEEQKVKLIPHEVILVGSIPECDFCRMAPDDVLGEVKPGPYDFKTRMGPWANACEHHYRMYRAFSDLGTGKGQLWVTEEQVELDPNSKAGRLAAYQKEQS